MELPVSAQALAAAYSLLIGVLIGLLYDVNRAWRFECRSSMSAAVADTLFCVCAACVLFVFSMGALDGRLRLSMLFCAGAGWGVYWLTLSRRVLPAARLLVKNWVKLLHSMGSHLSIIKKLLRIEKNIFSKLGLGFKMYINRRKTIRAGTTEGSASREARKGRYDYSSGSGRPHRVRSGGSGQRRSGDRQIRRNEERPRRKGPGAGRS
ncbi:MAG TPA: spore cortex biosynthesis protein YabQ [Candidatus Scatomorpha merdigallinarum]|nr:spore cortex biosynthesis protein YabQ [Candidatus Scatomorpha merdigallinarum]